LFLNILTVTVQSFDCKSDEHFLFLCFTALAADQRGFDSRVPTQGLQDITVRHTSYASTGVFASTAAELACTGSQLVSKGRILFSGPSELEQWQKTVNYRLLYIIKESNPFSVHFIKLIAWLNWIVCEVFNSPSMSLKINLKLALLET